MLKKYRPCDLFTYHATIFLASSLTVNAVHQEVKLTFHHTHKTPRTGVWCKQAMAKAPKIFPLMHKTMLNLLHANKQLKNSTSNSSGTSIHRCCKLITVHSKPRVLLT